MRNDDLKTRWNCCVTAAVALALLLGLVSALAQESPSPPRQEEGTPDADEGAAPSEQPEPVPAEIDGEKLVREKMQIFRAYEGEWDGVQSYAEAEGNPAFESKGSWTGSFQLDGMYLEMDGFSDYQSGRSLYRWMITYDVSLGKYRAWTFNSNGIVTDWLAQYDPEQKELTWHFVDARTRIRGWLKTQTQPNVLTGHGMAKTDGARVLSDYQLSFKRKKIRI